MDNQILRTLAFGAAGALTCTALHAEKAKTPTRQDGRPNVIFIMADDLGYGDLECYGAKNVKTPNINGLAKSGVRFTNCHATAATSTPSRYSILTGLYAWRKPGTGVAAGNAGMIIRPEQYTMADVFKSAGYSTAAIGKWHLGLGDKSGQQDWNAPLPTGLGDLGFDYSYIMAATADRVPCVFIENGQVANYDPSAPIYVDYTKNFPGEPTGKDNPEMLYNMKPSHGHDMSIVNGISRIGFMKGGGKALWKDENIADSITSHALGFIRDHASEPFFMYFCTNDVHVPRFPHQRFRGATNMGVRGDAIAEFDWTVGAILQELDRLGIADNTIVVLTSDNGPVVDDGYDDQAEELLNGHEPTGGLRGGKYSAFEGGTRVPFIVRYPGKSPKGKLDQSLFSHIDLLASFAEMLNVRIPEGHATDSYPRFNAMTGINPENRPWVLGEAFSTLMLRTPEWKYIVPSKGSPMVLWGPKIESGLSEAHQLYSGVDTLEKENVAQQHPDVVLRMADIIKAIRTNDTSALKNLDALP